MIEFLIAGGAEINARNKFGDTPLCTALSNSARRSMRENVNIASLLTAKGADLNCNFLLHKNITNQLFYYSEFLIKNGADVNIDYGSGGTPLHYWAAVQNEFDRNITIGELLIAKGANVNATDKFGTTPLHVYVEKSHHWFDTKDPDKLTKYTAVAKLLIANGGDINAKDNYGRTPMHIAAEEGKIQILEFLIENRADLNAIDQYGNTPLYCAASKGNTLLTSLLRSKGANLAVKNKTESASKSIPLSKQLPLNNIRMIDARSEQEKQNEQDGRNAKDLPPETAELLTLLVVSHTWGREHNWPHHDAYPKRKRICELGEQINNDYGFDGMQRVAYYIDAQNKDLTSHLTRFWHGVGRWLA
jgi:ankyrin repeat protein